MLATGTELPEAAEEEREHGADAAAAALEALLSSNFAKVRTTKQEASLQCQEFMPEMDFFLAGVEVADGAEEEGEGGIDAAAAAVEAVLSGKVAEVVFRNAIAALPRTVAVRRRFLDVLQTFTFPGITSIAQASQLVCLKRCHCAMRVLVLV